MRDGAYWERAYRDMERTYRGQAAELDRLRAEKAEMRAALQKISDWKTDGYEVAVAREALAKVNDPETDADLPTANDVRGILK